jgi:nitroimidazol reductase NimA-like FMN-containing flavoprotein (pyridoxamine 5'-phosphate oxidase superfamily)
MPPKIKPLAHDEVEELLAMDIPAHLATLDPDGYPRITPIWFIWADGAFFMTSVVGYPHLENLARDPRAAIALDTEDSTPVAGHRPNRRVRARGRAELFPDDGEWTKQITRKYIHGEQGGAAAEARAAMPRFVIRLPPTQMLTQRSP